MAAAALAEVEAPPWRWASESAPLLFAPPVLEQLAAGAAVHAEDVSDLVQLFRRAQDMLLADGVEFAPQAPPSEGADEEAEYIVHASACFAETPFAAPICAFLNARGEEAAGRAAAERAASEHAARAESEAVAAARRARAAAETEFFARYPTGADLAAATVGGHFGLDPNDAARLSRRALSASGGDDDDDDDAALLPFVALLAAWPSLGDAFDRFVRPTIWRSEHDHLCALIGAAIMGYRALPSSITAPAWAILRDAAASSPPSASDGAAACVSASDGALVTTTPRWALWAENLRTVFRFLGAGELSTMLSVSLAFEREACANELWIAIFRADPDYAGIEAHLCEALPHRRWDLAPYRYWRSTWVELRLSSRLVATCVNFGPPRTKSSGGSSSGGGFGGGFGSGGGGGGGSSSEDEESEDEESEDGDKAACRAIKNGYLSEDGEDKVATSRKTAVSAVSSVLRFGFSSTHIDLAR